MTVGGFEPLDLLLAIRDLSIQLADSTCENQNSYKRTATEKGNEKAKKVLDEVFESSDDEFRGIGVIPGSGFGIKSEFFEFDADKKFELIVESKEPKGCICGEILSGLKEPSDCPMFGKKCTPDYPIGSCMVSNEGACSAAFLYS